MAISRSHWMHALQCAAISLILSGQAAAHDEPALAPNEAAKLARAAVIREYPALMQAITRGGAFGGDFSAAIANKMYSRDDAAAIADARAKLKVELQGPRSWLLRLPFVNIALFETDAGLVLIDSGYAPAGPALRDVIKSLSQQPIHTIVFTHYHADHAWGAWALMDMGPGGGKPRIVSSAGLITQMDQDLLSYGLIARNNQQVVVPRNWGDVLRPDLTFHDRISLQVGGEEFVLTQSRGETEDQLWVSVPGRRIVVSADYYQGFMPNAGNGKRRQRYPEEWASALRQMMALKPQRLLSMHGPALLSEEEIQDKLGSHAQALESIAEQTLAGLNAGLRTDQVIDRIKLAPALAGRENLREDYSTAKDIARMVVKQYGGWWDDLPSHWNPAPLSEQGRVIAELAGGPRLLMSKAIALSRTDSALAASLADWAWLAAPADVEVLQGALQVYGARIGRDTTTQEALVYMEHMVRLKLQIGRETRP